MTNWFILLSICIGYNLIIMRRMKRKNIFKIASIYSSMKTRKRAGALYSLSATRALGNQARHSSSKSITLNPYTYQSFTQTDNAYFQQYFRLTSPLPMHDNLVLTHTSIVTKFKYRIKSRPKVPQKAAKTLILPQYIYTFRHKTLILYSVRYIISYPRTTNTPRSHINQVSYHLLFLLLCSTIMGD